VILELAGGTIEIDVTGHEGYVIGRSDSKSSYLPDIDLASYQGLEKGVSRRHAALVRYAGRLHLVDLNSVNGSFINGERLVSDVPYPINRGDEILLGSLTLYFK
jgi:pSer/pThr/pTyr-binding forkhead associated (FHA) protein